MRAPFSSSPSVPVHACKRRSKPSPTPRACATGATRSRSPHPTPRTRLPHATRRTYERPRAVPRAAADPTDPSRGRRARHGRALPALPASRRWRGADGSFENKAKGPPAGGDRDRRISREARARGDRAPRPGRVGLGRCAVTACLMRGGGRPGRLAKWRGALAPRTCHPRNLVAYSCWGAGGRDVPGDRLVRRRQQRRRALHLDKVHMGGAPPLEPDRHWRRSVQYTSFLRSSSAS